MDVTKLLVLHLTPSPLVLGAEINTLLSPSFISLIVKDWTGTCLLSPKMARVAGLSAVPSIHVLPPTTGVGQGSTDFL